MMDQAKISAETQGGLDGGGIDIAVRQLTLTGGSQITSNTVGQGRGGTITVTATEGLIMAGRSPADVESGLSSNTSGSGAAGAVVVHAGRVTMRDGATIASNTHDLGPGGSVSITATSLEVDQGLIQAQAATTSRGDAGTIVVSAGRVTLTRGAQISSSTRGTGQAGTVTVHATEALTIIGQNGPDDPSGLLSSTQGSGAAGAVVVEAGRITLREGGAIASDTFSEGQGGRVTVKTTTLEMVGGLIEAQTAQDSKGDAGAITVTARDVTVTGGARINSTTLGAGRGGSITVTATGGITIAGSASGLFTNTAGQGLGGDIAVQASQIQLTDGAVIAADSTGTGNAGSLALTARDTVHLQGHSAVTTTANQATGGNIRVTAPSMVRLQNSQITATVSGGSGDGGNVTIDPEFILLQGSQITANAFRGTGGRISLTASQAFLADPSSGVTASSTLGINGVVNIQAPVSSVSGAVAPLPQEFAPIAELLRDRCAGRLREGRVSRLVLGGRDGVPLEPGSLLLSPLKQVDQEGVVERGKPERQNPDAQPGWDVQVQAQARGAWEVACARWMGQPGTSRTPQRSR
jgi:large exoprotein involved in heme utilization and adhesion